MKCTLKKVKFSDGKRDLDGCKRKVKLLSVKLWQTMVRERKNLIPGVTVDLLATLMGIFIMKSKEKCILRNMCVSLIPQKNTPWKKYQEHTVFNWLQSQLCCIIGDEGLFRGHVRSWTSCMSPVLFSTLRAHTACGRTGNRVIRSYQGINTVTPSSKEDVPLYTRPHHGQRHGCLFTCPHHPHPHVAVPTAVSVACSEPEDRECVFQVCPYCILLVRLLLVYFILFIHTFVTDGTFLCSQFSCSCSQFHLFL